MLLTANALEIIINQCWQCYNCFHYIILLFTLINYFNFRFKFHSSSNVFFILFLNWEIRCYDHLQLIAINKNNFVCGMDNWYLLQKWYGSEYRLSHVIIPSDLVVTIKLIYNGYHSPSYSTLTFSFSLCYKTIITIAMI